MRPNATATPRLTTLRTLPVNSERQRQRPELLIAPDVPGSLPVLTHRQGLLGDIRDYINRSCACETGKRDE